MFDSVYPSRIELEVPNQQNLAKSARVSATKPPLERKKVKFVFFRNRKIAIFDAIFAPTSAFFLHQTHRKAFLPHRMTGQKF